MHKLVTTALRITTALGTKAPSIQIDVLTVVVPWFDLICSILSVR